MSPHRRLAHAFFSVLAATCLIACEDTTSMRSPQVHRSPAGADHAAPTGAATATQVVRAFMRHYLAAEVGRADPTTRARLRSLTTGQARQRAVATPRPTNRGYPPQGQLTGVQLLPVLRPGRWTLEAGVTRGIHRERWELHLTSTPTGPRITAFTPTTPRSTP